jgi:hypothetical protein
MNHCIAALDGATETFAGNNVAREILAAGRLHGGVRLSGIPHQGVDRVSPGEQTL